MKKLSPEDVERLLAPHPDDLFLINTPTLTNKFRTSTQSFDVTYFAEPHGEKFAVTRVVARPQQAADTPATEPPDDHAGPKAIAAAEAIAALWPNGIPKGLMAKDRDNQVIAWCEEHGRSAPSARTIQGAIKS